MLAKACHCSTWETEAEGRLWALWTKKYFPVESLISFQGGRGGGSSWPGMEAKSADGGGGGGHSSRVPNPHL